MGGIAALHSVWQARLAADYAGPFVPGEGAAHPRIVLIGEAPGREEAEKGRPFVGKAGKNLNSFLAKMGLSREEIYITNVVKVRPYRISERGTTANRPPTKAEVQAFLPWLQQEIQHLRPALLVTLGNTPLRAVLGEGAVIGTLHGQLIQREGEPSVFPLYHPAAIIYNRALSEVYDRDVSVLHRLL